MPAADENNESLLKTEAGRPVHVEIQRRIELVLQILETSAMDCGIVPFAETRGLSLLETTNSEAAVG